MSDLHEVVFRWPHTDPTTVIVTGSFDQWSQSVHLSRDDAGFAGAVNVPWAEKVAYKFIVDGRWATHAGQPTELDHDGNVNNVYTAPPRPPPAVNGLWTADDAPVGAGVSREAFAAAPVYDTVAPAASGVSSGLILAPAVDTAHADDAPALPDIPGQVRDTADPAAEVVHSPAVESAVLVVSDIPAQPAAAHETEVEDAAPAPSPPTTLPAEETIVPLAESPQATANGSAEQSSEADEAATPTSDTADTTTPHDGASTALSYITSSLGAAIQSVIGVDPITSAQIAADTPKPDAPPKTLPEEPTVPLVVEPGHTPTFAPHVPIAIIPVNDPSTNDLVPAPAAAAAKTPASLDPTPAEALIAVGAEADPEPTVVSSTPADADQSPAEPAPIAEPAAAALPKIAHPTSPADEPSTHILLSRSGAPPAEAPAAETPAAQAASETSPLTPEEITAASPADAISTAPAEPEPAPPSPEAAPETLPSPSESEEPTTASAHPTAPSLNLSTTAHDLKPAEPAQLNGSAPPESASAPKPTENGSDAPPAPPAKDPAPATPAPSAPSTPSKSTHHHHFPSTGSASANSSPTSSKLGTGSTRKKRQSLFGKLKNVFHHEKEPSK